MKRGAVILITVLLPIAVFVFAYIAREGERAVVRAASDFYIAALSNSGEISGSGGRAFVTDRFAAVLDDSSLALTPTCGISLPENVRVGDGAAWGKDGTAVVSFSKGEENSHAVLALRKVEGFWYVDAISCE